MEPRAAKARVALRTSIAALGRADRRGGDQQRADGARQQTPIKIGFMVPLSGGNAQNGRDILNGFLMYLDEIGYRAGGRKIQLIVEDDEAIPAVGLTKARKLVERDEVHVMAGALLSSTGYALAPYIDLDEDPDGLPGGVGRRPDAAATKRVDRAHRMERQSAESCVRRVRLPHAGHSHRWSTIALDYAFGWESVGGFERTFVAQGGRIGRRSGCRSPCTTSRPTSRKYRATSTRCMRCCSAAPRSSSCGNTRSSV